jgi:hypothetical protein
VGAAVGAAVGAIVGVAAVLLHAPATIAVIAMTAKNLELDLMKCSPLAPSRPVALRVAAPITLVTAQASS